MIAAAKAFRDAHPMPGVNHTAAMGKEHGAHATRRRQFHERDGDLQEFEIAQQHFVASRPGDALGGDIQAVGGAFHQRHAALIHAQQCRDLRHRAGLLLVHPDVMRSRVAGAWLHQLVTEPLDRHPGTQRQQAHARCVQEYPVGEGRKLRTYRVPVRLHRLQA